MFSMGLGRPEKVLILNYNTVLLQSVGFVNLMNQSGLDDKLFSHLDPFGLIYFFTRAKSRNTAGIIDPKITEDTYVDYLRAHYADISSQSPTTNIVPIIDIVKNQNFIDKVYLASYELYQDLDIFRGIDHLKLDIFDVEKVEKCIKDYEITSVFVHDIRMVHDLVFNFNIKVNGMSFIVSKLGYNFIETDGKFEDRCPGVFELREKFKFHIAYLNLHDSTRGFGNIEM